MRMALAAVTLVTAQFEFFSKNAEKETKNRTVPCLLFEIFFVYACRCTADAMEVPASLYGISMA